MQTCQSFIRMPRIAMNVLFVFELFILSLGLYAESGENLIVHLNHGSIRGAKSIDENGNEYFAFRGIPFAEPPIGNLRFKAPVPKQAWDEILDTVVDGPPCPQISFLNNEYDGKENNCLTLNVYTPQLPIQDNDNKLDVVVNIHGGGFAGGDGGEKLLFGSNRFMPKEKNIVLVSLTYRVGPLGFLSTMDASSPGNYGLLDQLEGLRWVRNNIDKFGGNPTKVTLFGESAGGASVMYHVLSPLSKGLFQKAIAMSGTPLDLWAHQYEPQQYAKILAQQVECPETNNTDELITCLKSKTARELINSQNTVAHSPRHFIFSPTVDNYFLPDTPYNIIKNKQYNDVPLLTGVTKDEGDCWNRYNNPDVNEELTDEEIEQLIGTVFNGIKNVDKAIQKVREVYFPSSHKNEDVQNSYAKLVTDGFFHKYHFQTVKMMTERKSKVYFYSYDYMGNLDRLKQLLKIPASADLGVCHGFDLAMFFTSPFFGQEPQTGEELIMKEQMQKLIFNFVLHGDPNTADTAVEWPPTEPNNLLMYHIEKECSVTTYDDKKDEMYKFWVQEIPEIFEYIQERSSNASYPKEEL